MAFILNKVRVFKGWKNPYQKKEVYDMKKILLAMMATFVLVIGLASAEQWVWVNGVKGSSPNMMQTPHMDGYSLGNQHGGFDATYNSLKIMPSNPDNNGMMPRNHLSPDTVEYLHMLDPTKILKGFGPTNSWFDKMWNMG
jgi:hypothetical protein